MYVLVYLCIGEVGDFIKHFYESQRANFIDYFVVSLFGYFLLESFLGFLFIHPLLYLFSDYLLCLSF